MTLILATIVRWTPRIRASVVLAAAAMLVAAGSGVASASILQRDVLGVGPSTQGNLGLGSRLNAQAGSSSSSPAVAQLPAQRDPSQEPRRIEQLEVVNGGAGAGTSSTAVPPPNVSFIAAPTWRFWNEELSVRLAEQTSLLLPTPPGVELLRPPQA